MTTHQHQQDRQEEQARREQRNKDIDLYGYAGAFKLDKFNDNEKYKLGGKDNERQERF